MGIVFYSYKTEIDKISEEAAENGGGNVLVVVHGLLITTLIEMLDSSKTKLGVENASVTKIVYQDGTYTVESVGDMSYVAKGKKVWKYNTILNRYKKRKLVKSSFFLF